MNNKKFGLLSVLNLVMITTLVLAACSQAAPTAVPEPATQAQAATLPTSVPAALATSSRPNPKPPDYWPTPGIGVLQPPSSRGWTSPRSQNCLTSSKRQM